jgi:CheY-like chemotaxis protein
MALVMVMEDNPDIAFVLKIALTEEGNEVISAPNGFAGLERLKQSPTPEIVFVDLKMPDISGRAVIEKMYSNPKQKNIPVVIMSGSLPETSKLPPKDSYNAFLSKPFDLEEAIDLVETLTNNKYIAI